MVTSSMLSREMNKKEVLHRQGESKTRMGGAFLYQSKNSPLASITCARHSKRQHPNLQHDCTQQSPAARRREEQSPLFVAPRSMRFPATLSFLIITHTVLYRCPWLQLFLNQPDSTLGILRTTCKWVRFRWEYLKALTSWARQSAGPDRRPRHRQSFPAHN